MLDSQQQHIDDAEMHQDQQMHQDLNQRGEGSYYLNHPDDLMADSIQDEYADYSSSYTFGDPQFQTALEVQGVRL